MSFHASFEQILRAKMTDSPSADRAHTESYGETGGEAHGKTQHKNHDEVHSEPAHMAYLLGSIGRFEFQISRGQYPRGKVHPQRKAHVFSEAQRQAFVFLKTWIPDLSDGFSESELKKAFRQAALILHPDRGGNPQDFISLRAQIAILQTVFMPPRAS